MKPSKLSTKARTLEALSDRVLKSVVLPLFYFTVSEWQKNPDQIIDQITEKFGKNTKLIVRSSALNEDTANQSMAGYFESIPDVLGRDSLKSAVSHVISSYGQGVQIEDEVLIQPMLSDVVLSGVVFSHDPSTASPYRVVNYVDGSDTTAVTSGTQSACGYVCVRGSDNAPESLKPILAMVDELEEIYSETPLDIEFAECSGTEKPILLQVRPLVLLRNSYDGSEHNSILDRIAQRVRCSQNPHPFLHGQSTVFGVMPDWNPAEIIGIRPRPLALSLYRDLVTDAIWAYQRHNYGYRNLRSFPLMVHFAGLPYIDVRVSFNSFIPIDIDGSLADRLVDYYIDRLVAAPTLHDKVEFEIVFSCYTLDLPERLKSLSEYGFTEREQEGLAESLRTLTNRIIHSDKGVWRQDVAKLERLARRREQILASGMNPVSRIYWLLEDCKRYGTLPFAGLARAGFVAIQMLKSMVAVGIFDHEDYDRFMNGLNTVSSQLSRDLSHMDRVSFLSRYGHLRPGTYNVLSPRYDETPDDYLGKGRMDHGPSPEKEPFRLSLGQMREIANSLQDHGLSSDVVGLFDFLQAGIEQREYAKFIFTRNLSDSLSMFREWGEQLGFSAEDLSYADISCIRDIHVSADDPEIVLRRSIEEGRERYNETSRICLPPLITKPDDVYAFALNEAEPNFITQASVTAAVCNTETKDSLTGKIVFITNADPGYDWLFSHKIAGLVTAYGGANSHMAIRANEIGLPAIIGAGETLFSRWSKAKKLHIDCAARRVEVLS